MAKYAKPKKTLTMEKGLRPLPPQHLDSFSPQEIAKMTERIELILSDSQILDERAYWIIKQALLAIAFRQAVTNEEKNVVMRQIQKHREGGHRLSFSETEIRAINRVVLEKDSAGQLEALHQKLLARREKG